MRWGRGMVAAGVLVSTSNRRDQRGQFEAAVLPHLDALYTAALRLTHNVEDSKDLVQDAVLRGYRNFHQFQDGTNCRAWLLTIMYNLFRTAYRRSGREQPAANLETFERGLEAASNNNGAGSDPAKLLEQRRTGREIERAMAQLPPEFRECLLLIDFHELDYQEAATVLNVPLGTIKSRVSRGRALLRLALTTGSSETCEARTIRGSRLDGKIISLTDGFIVRKRK